MKKLLVMVIVMAVVFGMSAGVMASLVEKEVEVGVKVNQYAEVTLDNLRTRDDGYDVLVEESDRAIVDLLELGRANDHAIGWDISVKSNANVNITVQENVSRTLAEADITPYRLDDNVNSNDWQVAPNVELFTSNWSNHDSTERPSAWKDGTQDGINGVKQFDGILQFNAQISPDRYEDVAPETYEGEVIVTVIAE